MDKLLKKTKVKKVARLPAVLEIPREIIQSHPNIVGKEATIAYEQKGNTLKILYEIEVDLNNTK